MPTFGLWSLAVLLTIISSGMLLSRSWRFSLGLMALQYFAAFFLLLVHWPLNMAATILVSGWMAIAALGMTLTNIKGISAVDTSWPEGIAFRIIASALVILVLSVSAENLGSWLPNSPLPLTWGALMLIGQGILHLGLTIQPLRVITGLLTTLTGFELLYTNVENSILVVGGLVVVILGLSLVGSYLLTLGAEKE